MYVQFTSCAYWETVSIFLKSTIKATILERTETSKGKYLCDYCQIFVKLKSKCF